MMQKILLILAFVLVAGVIGCGPSDYSVKWDKERSDRDAKISAYAKQAQTEDCGSTANWKTLVKDAISAQLKDPYSAQFEFNEEPRKGFSELKNGQVVFLWVVWVRVNAKNSYGGYSGYKNWIVHFRDGVTYDVHSWNF